MRSKVIVIMTIAMIALITVLSYAYKCIDKLAEENKRLQANQEAYNDTVTCLRTVDGLNAWRIKRLELSKKEFTKYNSDLAEQVKNLKIKIKQLESVEKITQKTEYVFVPDTVYIEGNPHYKYQNAWINFDMDSTGVNLQTTDTIYIVRHQKIKRFLFWVRRKELYVTVNNTNPYVATTNIQSITIDK